MTGGAISQHICDLLFDIHSVLVWAFIATNFSATVRVHALISSRVISLTRFGGFASTRRCGCSCAALTWPRLDDGTSKLLGEGAPLLGGHVRDLLRWLDDEERLRRHGARVGEGPSACTYA